MEKTVYSLKNLQNYLNHSIRRTQQYYLNKDAKNLSDQMHSTEYRWSLLKTIK